MRKFLAVLVIGILSAPVGAAQKTVILSVPTMDCPVCPITVKKSLAKLTGVSQVDVDFEKRQAIIIFDDSKASVETLTRATNDAGYPSKPVGSAK